MGVVKHWSNAFLPRKNRGLRHVDTFLPPAGETDGGRAAMRRGQGTRCGEHMGEHICGKTSSDAGEDEQLPRAMAHAVANTPKAYPATTPNFNGTRKPGGSEEDLEGREPSGILKMERLRRVRCKGRWGGPDPTPQYPWQVGGRGPSGQGGGATHPHRKLQHPPFASPAAKS